MENINENKITFKEVMTKTYSVYKKYFLAITLMALLCSIPNEISNYYIGDDNGVVSFVSISIITILESITSIFVIVISYKALKDEDISLKKIYTKYIGKLPGVCIITLVLIMGTLALSILFVIPGIMFAVASTFAISIYILEDKKAMESIGMSWDLTQGFRGIIFLYTALNFIIIILVDKSIVPSYLLTVLNLIVYTFICPIFTIITTVLYDKIKTIKRSI